MDKPNNGRDWMHILNALTAHPLVVEPTPLKNDGVKVSWGDDIPKIWNNNVHVPNYQPDVDFSCVVQH